MAVSQTVNNEIFDRIYNLKGLDDCRSTYDEWATNYDKDVSGEDYVGPALAAQAVLNTLKGNINGTVFDAGCGTGLVGVALKKLGAKDIDGADLSEGMIRVAEQTGAYRHLTTVDLSKAIDKPDDTYEVVTCVGTLTQAHVGPDPALKEFVRISKKGGVVVATILDNIWVPGGYEAEVQRLANGKQIEVVSTDLQGYRSNLKARMIILRKL